MVLIYYAKKSAKLTTPDVKGVANHAKVNHMEANQGSELPVVNVFPDVFPKELPGMPPD
jgi:hypothetical protein